MDILIQSAIVQYLKSRGMSAERDFILKNVWHLKHMAHGKKELQLHVGINDRYIGVKPHSGPLKEYQVLADITSPRYLTGLYEFIMAAFERK